MDDVRESDENLDREVAERSASYELARADEGWRWGVWARGVSDEPIAMYPTGEAGAHRFGAIQPREVPSLPVDADRVVVALGSGLAWIISTVVFQIGIDVMSGPFQSDGAYEAILWTQVVAGIAQTIFEVSVGLSIILWLMDRDPRADAR